MKPRNLVFLLLFPLIILTGCPKPEIRYTREPPPPNLVARTPLPERQGDTIGAVVEWVVPMAGALESCNSDKESLRLWGLNGK